MRISIEKKVVGYGSGVANSPELGGRDLAFDDDGADRRCVYLLN